MFNVGVQLNPTQPASAINGTGLFTVISEQKFPKAPTGQSTGYTRIFNTPPFVLTIKYTSKVPGLYIRTEMKQHPNPERAKHWSQRKYMTGYFEKDPEYKAVHEIVIDTDEVTAFDIIDYIRPPTGVSLSADELVARQRKYWRCYLQLVELSPELDIRETGDNYKIIIGHGARVNFRQVTVEHNVVIFKGTQIVRGAVQASLHTDTFLVPNTVTDFRLELTNVS